MSEIGYNYNVCDEDLNELIEKVNLDNPIAILEKRFCPDGEEPAYFDFLSALKGMVSDWSKGRVFDLNSEIRWEKNWDCFHIVWIIHNGNITVDWEKEPLFFKEKRKVLLWGERIENKDEWYEKQIPKILKYPVEGKGHKVYLEIMEYNMSDGSPIFRFEGLVTE
jgi:hypothetical protein